MYTIHVLLFSLPSLIFGQVPLGSIHIANSLKSRCDVPTYLEIVLFSLSPSCSEYN